MEAIAKKPVVVIKDKFGRVMERKAPKMATKRLPTSVNRAPLKKPPPKMLLSFTECQLKYYGAADIYNPLQNYPKPSLTDLHVINLIKECDRFPIPEAILGRKKLTPYTLRIDSMMLATYKMESIQEWANYRQEIDAPFNSMESADEFPLYDS
jgi:hypothetical protein